MIHIAKFKRNDKRTTYNLVYRDGRTGPSYMKRFFATGVTRDKEYNMMQGTPGSKIMYFSANPNGEAEVLLVKLKPKPRMRSTVLDVDFGVLAIKGRSSKGNLVTKNEVFKVTLKQRGVSTLGGRKIFFDWDVLRINSDRRGDYLGEFQGEDKILVVGEDSYYTSSFDLSNHFDAGVKRIEKFDSEKVWSAVYFDADQKLYYIKRFAMETSQKAVSIIGENEKSKLILLSSEAYPQFEITFAGADKMREPLKVDVEEFIAVKGFKARGKRLTTHKVGSIKEIVPLGKAPEEEAESLVDDDEVVAIDDESPREYVFDDVEATEPPKKGAKKAVKPSDAGDDKDQLKLFDDKIE